MLKSVSNLIRDYKAGKKKATYGNHWMQVTENGVKFYYHATAICTVENGNVTYDAGQWAGSSSTTRAINSYKQYFC